MENKGNAEFENERLRIDKERVLTYSGLVCPLDCKYCFVEHLNAEQSKGSTYLNEKQIELLGNLPPDVNLIMLGCDTELFQKGSAVFKTLERISDYQKDISIVTKIPLDKRDLLRLKEIDKKLGRSGNIFTLSYSIPCLGSYRKWEPKVPSPEKRLASLRESNSLGLKSLVAVRPLLPDLADEEMAGIIQETKDFCLAYYSGPLYLKDLDILENKENLNIELVRPHWMPEGNEFYRVEKPGQMERLRELIEKTGKNLFDGAADAIKAIKAR
ncbi:MAG: hypothetical protein ACM3KM_02415 [Acidobacteriaceae bacterium]